MRVCWADRPALYIFDRKDDDVFLRILFLLRTYVSHSIISSDTFSSRLSITYDSWSQLHSSSYLPVHVLVDSKETVCTRAVFLSVLTVLEEGGQAGVQTTRPDSRTMDKVLK